MSTEEALKLFTDRHFDNLQKFIQGICNQYMMPKGVPWYNPVGQIQRILPKDREKRLGQLAIIEAIVDYFNHNPEKTSQYLAELGLDEKLVIFAALSLIIQLIQSEYGDKKSSSRLQGLLEQALNKFQPAFRKNSDLKIEAERQFFAFINDDNVKRKLEQKLSGIRQDIKDKYSIEIGNSKEILKRLSSDRVITEQKKENQRYRFLTINQRYPIDECSKKAARSVSNLFALFGISLGATAGDVFASNYAARGMVTGGGAFLGFAAFGLPGALIGAVGFNHFSERLLKNTIVIGSAATFGKAFKKASETGVYYLVYTPLGAAVVIKNAMTGAYHVINDPKILKEFSDKIPDLHFDQHIKSAEEQEELGRMLQSEDCCFTPLEELGDKLGDDGDLLNPNQASNIGDKDQDELEVVTNEDQDCDPSESPSPMAG